jgi:hyperosmotically inducible periplasmic protein
MSMSHIVLALGVLTGAAQPATNSQTQIAQEVRNHLLSLTYYGVYDLITFNVDQNNVVTLGGYVMTDTLKKDAEREAREVKDVKEVQNKIEVAPGLPMDDNIRHGVYHAIYGDAALSRYGTPESEMRSMRPGFRAWGSGLGGWGFGGRGISGGPFASPSLMAAPFYGYDPVGNYAIHILVKDRVVTLVGVVDSDGDKTLAGLKARAVGTVLTVNNDLQVATQSSPTK